MTDAEWAVIAPLMPEPAPCGRPPVWATREVLNTIFDVLRGGIAWRMLPKDLPPRSTTFGSFSRWRDAGLFARINHDLVMADRERAWTECSTDGRGARESERQDHRERRAARLRRWQEGQGRQASGARRYGQTRPRPRSAAGQRPGPGWNRASLRLSRRTFPFIAKAFADAGYAGDKPAAALIVTVRIVRKPLDQVGFAVHPRRWVVERFFGWISRNRRLWKDPEAPLASAQAFLYAAALMILVRRLGRASGLTGQMG
nr:IS5 family transposase [Methylobacterium sp. Leaf465]